MTLVACSGAFVFVAGERNVLLVLRDEKVVSQVEFEAPICTIAAEGNTVAVAIKKQGGTKKENLFIYKLKGTSLKLSYGILLNHDAIEASFCMFDSRETILVLDSGDINAIDIESHENRFLLGSVVAGTSFRVHGNLIINSDRDARIRISRFPETYSIRAFALLHQEFVSCVDFISDNEFVSVDGDGMIVKWTITGIAVTVARPFGSGVIIRRVLALPSNTLAVIVEGQNEVFFLSHDLVISSRLAIPSQPLFLALQNDSVLCCALDGLYVIRGGEVQKIVDLKLDMKDWTLEGLRVNSKKIIKRGDKSSDDYLVWRDPERVKK